MQAGKALSQAKKPCMAAGPWKWPQSWKIAKLLRSHVHHPSLHLWTALRGTRPAAFVIRLGGTLSLKGATPASEVPGLYLTFRNPET